MKTYESMKSSSVFWLGMIPEHWECMKIGSLFSQRKVKVSDKDYTPLSVTKMGILPQLENAAKTNDGDNRKLVCAGDFVINSRSDRKGSCGISELNGSVSLINIVLTPRSEWNNRYAHYLLRSQPFSEEYYRYGRGIVADLWTTRFSEMKNILFPVPPREEQDQIVRFLDWKVSEINRLINIKRREIERLEELKNNTITRYTTKGLNGNVELKYSGTEWLGDIPVHWEAVQLRRVFTVILGKMLAPNPSSTEDTYEKYVCAKDVHFDGVDLTSLKKMWFSPSEKKQYEIKSGDLLIVEGGAGAGNAALVSDLNGQCIYVQNSIHIVRTKSDQALNKFLCCWIGSLVKRGYMKNICSVATIPHYTKDKVLSTIMPLAPIEEQAEIVAFLDKKCQEIDELISFKEQQIQSLQEFKIRLILDVVTGKVDVRGIKVPKFEYVEEIEDDFDGDKELEEKSGENTEDK